METDPYRTSDGKHLFGVVGDSIARGTNNRNGEPIPSNDGTLYEFSGASVSQVIDIASAVDGSQWPSFAVKWKALKSADTVISMGAIGGAEWFPNGDTNNWHTSGANYNIWKAEAEAMEAHYSRKMYAVIINLGINDARGTKPLADIQAAMFSLIDRINADFSAPRIYIVQLGREERGLTNRIRDIQKLIDNADPSHAYNDGGSYGIGLLQRYANLKKAEELERYIGLGLYGTDNLHLSQNGNNHFGEQLAAFIAGDTK